MAALESITVQDVYDAFVRYLLPPSASATSYPAAEANTTPAVSSSQRRKLSVQISPHKQMGEGDTTTEAPTQDKSTTAVNVNEATAMAVDGGDETAMPTSPAPAMTSASVHSPPLPASSSVDGTIGEPEVLLEVRGRFAHHPLQLGTAPAPLMGGA